MLAVGRFGRVSVRLAQEGATVAINFVGPPATAEETLGLVRAASADRAHGERDHFIVRADIGRVGRIWIVLSTMPASSGNSQGGVRLVRCLIQKGPDGSHHLAGTRDG